MPKQAANKPSRIDLRRSAPLFAALGDETRLQLLVKLGTGVPQSITQLTLDLPLTRQAVTKHLRVLERASLVTEQQAGRERKFSARPAGINQAQAVLQAISAQWDDALGRLQAFCQSSE